MWHCAVLPSCAANATRHRALTSLQIDKSHPMHPRNEDAKKKKLQVRLALPLLLLA